MEQPGIAAFFRSFGIEPEEVAEFERSQGATGVYELVSDGGEATNARPDALCIKRSGRFGNNIIQINKAIAVAEALGVKWIDLRQLELPLTRKSEGIIHAGGLNFVLSGPTPKPWTALTGYFWETGIFSKLGLRNADWALSYFTDHIRILFDRDRLLSGPEDCLTIHIRSGDLFGDPQFILPYLTPPPLSYYTLCIKHAMYHSGISRVLVVYEDRNNPCVDALEAHLQQTGIEHQFQSSSLEDDIAAVAKATHLVTGPGTFAPSAGLIGGNTKTIYYFRMAVHWQLLHQEGTQVFSVGNPSRDYFSENEWGNLDHQRTNMLALPEHSLSIKSR